MIMSHTVVFPEAVPPETPMTKGCWTAEGEASSTAAAAAAVPLA
uniref:Pco087306 n=1 Tax=Arundo donax TaxID=35708 RepID=A0A0A9CQ64_ARUDO